MPPKGAKAKVVVGDQPKVEQLLPSSELLAYYKARVDDFNNERQGLLEALDRCAVQQAEVHQLEWENRKRAEEIRDLQKALSDAHNFLFEERERLLALQAENDALRLQEVQDRARIRQLLALTQPLEQEITYHAETQPHSVALLPRPHRPPTGQPGAGARAGPGGGGKGAGGALQQQQQQQQQERVLRTVFLPTANTDFLTLQVESLQAQLAEQKQLAEERVAALLEERRIRGQEEEAHRAQLTAQLEALSARLKKAEEVLRTTTKDFILAKKARQEAESRAVAADAQLLQERQVAAQQRAVLADSKAQELESQRQVAAARLDEYVAKFRQELREREDELMALESVHHSTKAQYEARVTDLAAKVKSLQRHNEQLEARRAADTEGFTADISALRRKLCEVDRKLHAARLAERLQDDDRLDTILARLKARAPSVPATPVASRSELARTFSQEMAGELQGVKAGLQHLDERLRTRCKGGRLPSAPQASRSSRASAGSPAARSRP